jgi:YVTN family beta-propeller protein
MSAQESFEMQDPAGATAIQNMAVQKGQTLLDFMEFIFPDDIQTDIDPGLDPEGDFMFRPAFTTDGEKVLVPNGGTDNVTIFDFETMMAEAIVEVGDYPCDVALTDQYAVVPCIFGDEIYVIDLQDYSIAATFATPSGAQPCVVEVSSDGNYAFIACDINDQCEVIDLQTLTQLDPIPDFPVSLVTFSWISTGGRSSFSFSRFEVSTDGDHLILGNAENEVLFVDPLTGNIDYSVADIPNCFTVGLSGDGQKTIALSEDNGVFKAYRLDNTTHAVDATVTLSGQAMAIYDVVADMEGNKAFTGIGNNSSVIIRFETEDYVTFTQTYTPFWLGVSYDHQYAVSGQYRFSILEFDSETMIDQLQGYTQNFGCVSPVAYEVLSFDPLRYEGVYFFEFSDPDDIQFNGKTIGGWPPEGDTPYRIAISPDGTRAVTSNSISENASIINLETYEVEAILELEESCDALAITHDSQWAVMGGYDLNTIKLIDLTTNEYVASVYTGQRPLMVTIAPDDSYAYIGNLKQNSVSFVELDGAASSEVAEIPTGVIGLSWAAFGVRSSVELDPTGQYVLVAASFEDQVQVIDVAQQQIVANLPVGTFPLKIAFNEDGDYAAVTNYSNDTYSIIHLDGASSSVVGTFSAGDGPLRLAYNPVNDEFGIVNYSSKTVINVDPATGTINSTDSYTQYGNPIMIQYDTEGNPIVLTLSTTNDPGHIIRKDNAIVLPATPTYFDYCPATNTAVVCMPGPDYVTVIEYDQSLDPPVADFTANVTTVQVGGDVQFTDLSQNNPSAWEWSFEGGDPSASAAQNPLINYPVEGIFDVTLLATNLNGADEITKTDYITVLPTTYIFEAEDRTTFTIYPNPVSDQLTIGDDNAEEREVFYAVFNAQGRRIGSGSVSSLPGKIDFSGMEPGLYFLKISAAGHSESYRIIKR